MVYTSDDLLLNVTQDAVISELNKIAGICLLMAAELAKGEGSDA